MRKFLKNAGVVSGAALLATGVSASNALAQATTTGPDFTPLTDAIDVTSTVAGVMAAGGIVIAVALAVMGIRKVISMVRGA